MFLPVPLFTQEDDEAPGGSGKPSFQTCVPTHCQPGQMLSKTEFCLNAQKGDLRDQNLEQINMCGRRLLITAGNHRPPRPLRETSSEAAWGRLAKPMDYSSEPELEPEPPSVYSGEPAPSPGTLCPCPPLLTCSPFCRFSFFLSLPASVSPLLRLWGCRPVSRGVCVRRFAKPGCGGAGLAPPSFAPWPQATSGAMAWPGPLLLA